MKTRFKINEKVWIFYQDKPFKLRITSITINKNGIRYIFEVNEGRCTALYRWEERVGKTKEELRDIIFK